MRGCRTQWPLTLTYIFKVIRPWLKKLCPLCSIYSSGWILFIPHASTKLKRGYTGFTLSVCGQNCVCSVSSTILMRSISYLYILSSNVRRCVACNVSKCTSNIWNFGEFFKCCNFDFVFFWLGIQYDSMVWVIMRWRVVSSERRRSSCSSYIWYKWSLSLEGVSRVFSESENLNLWQIFSIFRSWPWKKSTVLDGFFPYLAQMITGMRVCVAYIMTFDLDLYLQGHLALALKIVSAL